MNKREAISVVKERLPLLQADKKFLKLVTYVQEQRELGRAVLWPDPLDGGLEAPILLLALAPTVEEAEVGMASTDFLHPDFVESLKDIDRKNIFYWSVVPWPVRNRFAFDKEHQTVRTGLRMYGAMTGLLRNLTAVVLLGQRIQTLRTEIEAVSPRGVRFYETWSVDKRSKLGEERLCDIQETLHAASEFASVQTAVRMKETPAKEPMYVYHR